MPFSSGTFTRVYNWITDRNAAVKIRADRMDEEMDGFATGLSNTICRDGQSTISANIPFNNKKITGLADATAATDALNRQTADARYTLNIPDLTNESAVADADSFPFYDASAAANRRVTYTQLKTDLIAETNFIPANKVVNTPAGTIASTTVQAALDELDTEKAPTSRTLTAAGLVTGGGTLAADRTFTVTAATQADEETATSTTTAVVPGRQHYHPTHPKSWLYADLTSGTPTVAGSHGISSLTDIATGNFDINLTTAFSSVNYAMALSGATSIASQERLINEHTQADRTASKIEVRVTSLSGTNTDAATVSAVGLGDQ